MGQDRYAYSQSPKTNSTVNATGSGVDLINIHPSRWPGTTANGDHFVVEGFPITGNRNWPEMPGTDNQYTRPPLREYPVGDPGPNPNDFFTELDVCVPDDPNSLPTPFVP